MAYSYANNNPISFKDPTGLEPEGEKGKDEVQVYHRMSPDDWNLYMLKACSEINSMSFLEDQMARDFRRNLFNFAMDQHYGSGGGGGGGNSSSGVNGKRTGKNSDNGTNTTSTEKSTFEKVVDAFTVAIDFIGSILYDNTVGLIPGLSNSSSASDCKWPDSDNSTTPLEVGSSNYSYLSKYFPAFVGVSVGSSSYVGFGTGTSLDLYFQLKGNGAGSFYLTMTQQLGLGIGFSPIYLNGNSIWYTGSYSDISSQSLITSIKNGDVGGFINLSNSTYSLSNYGSGYMIQYSYTLMGNTYSPIDFDGSVGIFNTFLFYKR